MKSINKKADEFIKYLEKLKNSSSKKDKDKLTKLSQWLFGYSKYLNFEETFKPQKLIKYHRGDIVKVNFGFNVGNELGGVHYAVVLDNNNSHSSGTLTVVPLSSTKEKDTDTIYTVDLGDMLNECLNEKREKLRISIQEKSAILGEEYQKLSETFNELDKRIRFIAKEKIKSNLKCNVISNPNEHGYFLIDKKCFVIKPKGKNGLGSLPNGVCDKIYTKETRIFHEQAIGKLLINGSENWEVWKENSENIAFKINNFAATTGLNEVTTFCSHFISRTFIEIDELNIGIFQGGENGDLYICVNKKDLVELTVEGLKKYLYEYSKHKPIELYYELKEHLIYELPALTQEELDNPQNVFKKSEIINEFAFKVLEDKNKYEEDLNKSNQAYKEVREEMEYEKKVKEELDRIKIGSKALVSQITTVSKLRVIDPKHKNGALYGISVNEQNLKKIDEKIENLFFKKLDTK